MLVEKGIEMRKWHQWLNLGIGGAFLALSWVPCFFLYTFLTTSDLKKDWDLWLLKLAKEGRKQTFEKEGDELHFSQKEEKRVSLPLPEIEEALLFLKKSERAGEGEKKILLGLAGSGEKRFIHEGEKVFLRCPSEKEITFADEATPFSLEVEVLHSGELTAKLKVEALDREGVPLFTEEKRVEIKEREDGGGILVQPNHPLYPLAKEVEKVRLLPVDQLIELYGGPLFGEERGKYRLMFGGESEFLFIRPGDVFTYEGGKWEKGEGKGKPTLVFEKIDGKMGYAVLWDEENLYSQTYKFPLIKGAPVDSFAKAFKKIRKRGDHSVTCTCVLGNHNLILREGDWVLKTERGWKVLQEASLVKDYLRFVLKGELFIFDKVEKEGNAKYLVGSYFNELRTSVEKVRIPLFEETRKPRVAKGSGGVKKVLADFEVEEEK